MENGKWKNSYGLLEMTYAGSAFAILARNVTFFLDA
jgi:hypothetical protein